MEWNPSWYNQKSPHQQWAHREWMPGFQFPDLLAGSLACWMCWRRESLTIFAISFFCLLDFHSLQASNRVSRKLFLSSIEITVWSVYITSQARGYSNIGTPRSALSLVDPRPVRFAWSVQHQGFVSSSQLRRGTKVRKLHNFTTSQLQNFKTSQLQNFKTPKLQNPKTPKLQNSKTPKLQNLIISWYG